MVLYYRYGYGWWASFSHGNNKFMWVVKGLHPRRIPTSEARGGASVAVNNVKHWLRMMDNAIKAVGYDLYTDDETRYVRFKSPFDRRSLVGPRPRFRNNEEKRTLRLVGSSNPEYIRQCEEAAFGDFDSDDDWEYEDEQ